MSDKDVHTEHCCSDHGCKYNEPSTCPVVQGVKPQSYPCDLCRFFEQEIKDFLGLVPDDALLAEVRHRILADIASQT